MELVTKSLKKTQKIRNVSANFSKFLSIKQKQIISVNALSVSVLH